MSNKKVGMMHLSPIWLMSQSGCKDKKHIRVVMLAWSVIRHKMHSWFHDSEDLGVCDDMKMVQKGNIKAAKENIYNML